jgi:hypothetical protein
MIELRGEDVVLRTLERGHILGILLRGYPAVRFLNKVEGRRMDIEWVGDQH